MASAATSAGPSLVLQPITHSLDMFAKQGWRFVFYMMAGVAGLTTILLLIFGIEPRNLNAKPPKDPKPKLSSPARGAVQRGVGALKVGFT